MSIEKQSLFSYGITELESVCDPSTYEGRLSPGEECYFYVVALFYQGRPDVLHQSRGGNRGELILEEGELFYRILPQMECSAVGRIRFE